MSDPTPNTSGHGVSRAALSMTIGVLALGTLISWTVIRTQATADITRRGDAPPAEITAVVDTEQAAVLIGVGAAVIQQRCAGCHDSTQRLVAPSWTAVLDRYKSVIGAQPLNADALALMVTAITHPRPGWDGYAAGPANIPLSDEEATGTAAWVLKSSTSPAIKELTHE
ncbi:c-type cytochrome [Pseudomonas sp. ZS1P83]